MQLKAPLSSTCQACLERLIDLTVGLATSDESLRENARRHALGILEEFKNRPDVTPAYIATRFHPVIKALCHNEDPFKQRKLEEIRTARALAEKILEGMQAEAGNTSQSEAFRKLLILSLLGNGLDFFRKPEDLSRLISEKPEIPIDEGARLYSRFTGSSVSAVFLADNAGEVFFDLPLMKFLVQMGHRVFYAVKGAPVQNDLSWQDLEHISVDWDGVTVISTGCATVGLELEYTSGYFQKVYNGADVVIGKGMGHYETLGDTRDERVFLLFQAKCVPVASSLGVPLNSFIIMQPACRRT